MSIATLWRCPVFISHMSQTATPTPPSTAAQVSPILKLVENTGSEPVMVTSPGGGGGRPLTASRMPMTSSNAVATSQSSLQGPDIMPRQCAQVYAGHQHSAAVAALHLLA